MIVVSWVCGLALALICYFLCIELRIHPAVAFIVTAVVIIDPANVLYASWYFDTYPTALLMTFGASAS